MTDKQTATASGDAPSDPQNPVSGDEPMTGAQRACLQTLSQAAGLPFDASLTKAQACKRIDELQRITGVGEPATSSAGEEDPGAALDDPAMRDAMRAEAQLTRSEATASPDEPPTPAPWNAGDGDGGDPATGR